MKLFLKMASYFLRLDALKKKRLEEQEKKNDKLLNSKKYPPKIPRKDLKRTKSPIKKRVYIEEEPVKKEKVDLFKIHDKDNIKYLDYEELFPFETSDYRLSEILLGFKERNNLDIQFEAINSLRRLNKHHLEELFRSKV